MKRLDLEVRLDTERGLYRKYHVERLGGTPGKHDDCAYFVLDLMHDIHARSALRAYAESCRAEYPELAVKLDEIVGHTETMLGLEYAWTRVLPWPGEPDR